MNDAQQFVERYLATWNETDPAALRAAVEALWTEDGAYTDPLADVAGHDAIAATIGAVQEQFPGLVFRAGGPVDAHHDQARFTWELGPEGGEALVVGFDVAVFAADGRLGKVYGFLDKVPTA
ncbi:nuclear transport factor 2 family protein [Spirillospora sp. NBC_01491]|uniref:nuclear transport factor 2 family protein n=1 Tax=Spirillospora sp. NBC_01491 TaxID=2976007 RepID=UPI002E33911A|nr:nuclear transport factor 2 family protein [Spirillospora sp. NBC_01491]